MASSALLESLRNAHSSLEILTPTTSTWAKRRETRGHSGQERKPLGIAIPKDAQEVSDVVRWATSCGVEVTVRSGGNEFYGRNVVDGGLIIDMRDINFIHISKNKQTATIGGGVITKDLVVGCEDEGVIVPFGNTWIVGYVGWATLGGYGPLTNLLGMGFEGIVGAELVDANGDIFEAKDEILEGIRGMGGSLGIITLLTIKVYPARKLLSGMLLFDATPDNINSIVAAESKLDIPKSLNLHHFILKLQDRMLAILFTWSGQDHEEGKKYLQEFTQALPPVKANTVASKTPIEHHEQVPLHCLPWGGQRSFFVTEMSPKILETMATALHDMPPESNMGWSMTTNIDPNTAPANCFSTNSHILLTFSDMVSKESLLAEAIAWSDRVYDKLRRSRHEEILEAAYAPLTRPGDRSAEQLYGVKWPRVKELKAKYDPKNVFKHVVPAL